MLTWKEHVHSATLHVFPREKRLAAYRTIGRISEMVRSFVVGNLFVGLLNAVASTAVFWYVHLAYFCFLGVISAFVGLVPYWVCSSLCWPRWLPEWAYSRSRNLPSSSLPWSFFIF
jgi:predicted PurR-regulated permease PerM